MPIYAYRCESCGFAKDVLQKVSDPQLTDCPTCGKSTFKKQVTAAGFQLKGTGWYVTDFRGGSGAKTSAPATADAPAGGHAADCPAAAATESAGTSATPAPSTTSSSSGGDSSTSKT